MTTAFKRRFQHYVGRSWIHVLDCYPSYVLSSPRIGLIATGQVPERGVVRTLHQHPAGVQTSRGGAHSRAGLVQNLNHHGCREVENSLTVVERVAWSMEHEHHLLVGEPGEPEDMCPLGIQGDFSQRGVIAVIREEPVVAHRPRAMKLTRIIATGPGESEHHQQTGQERVTRARQFCSLPSCRTPCG